MSAEHITKKDVVSEFRRTGILKAARKVFAQQGYDGATMDDVAEASDIAKGTLYLYFRSKRDIYLGVLHEDLQSLREATVRAIASAADAPARIRAFVTTRFEFCGRHSDFFRIYNTDIATVFMTTHPLQTDLREFYLEQAGMLATIISDGIRNGELRNVNPQSAAFAIYDMTRACISRRVLGLTNEQDDAESLLDLISKGIGRA